MRSILQSVLRALRAKPGQQGPAETALGPLDPELLALRDAALSGWFQVDSNELFRGFALSAEDVVLDIGCGDGGNAQFCAKSGAALILADIDAATLGTAVRRVADASGQPVRAFVTDSNPLPLRDGTVSALICTEVIEHVDDPVSFLAELVRVGRPGARYLLTVPDPIIEELQTFCAAPAYFERPNHLRILQRDEFAGMVTAAGLEIEQRDSYGSYWSIWWLLAWAAGEHWPDDLQPMVKPWSRTWNAILDTPRGRELKRVLDDMIPKSQLILARKP